MNFVLIFFIGWGAITVSYLIGKILIYILFSVAGGKQLKKTTIDGVEYLTDITESELYYLDGTEVPNGAI